MENPKVSVLTVCKNAEKTIEQTILSVLCQTYPDIEYIIIDGASTDETLNIINRYRSHISVVISEPDTGTSEAFNKGLSKSSGDVIVLLNSDDWFASDNTIETLVKKKVEKKADVVYAGFRRIYPNGDTSVVEPAPVKDIWYGERICIVSAIIDRKVFEEVATFSDEYKIINDWDFIVRTLSKGVTYSPVENTAINFRMGGVSDKAENRIKWYKEAVRMFEEYSEYFPDKPRLFSMKKWMQYEINLCEDTGNKKAEEVLKAEFEYYSGEIAIWGTGAYGNMLYTYFKGGPIEIKYWLDNDEKKWGSNQFGKSILPVKDIKADRHLPVLVAIKDIDSKLKKQIDDLRKEKIQIITLEDFVERFDYEIPVGASTY